jgi:hypothetical protein
MAHCLIPPRRRRFAVGLLLTVSHRFIVREYPRLPIGVAGFVAHCLGSGDSGKGALCKTRARFPILSANALMLARTHG